MNVQEAYMILGVNSSDGDEIIKKRYRELIKLYHPDKHLEDNFQLATRKTQEINAAYELIAKVRGGDSEDSNWDLTVNMTYKGPKRPKGRINSNAYILRSKFGYDDIQVIWNPRKEDEYTFLNSFYKNIIKKLSSFKNDYDVLYVAPIIKRIEIFAAAEYIDAYRCVCDLYEINDVDGASIIIRIPTVCDVSDEVINLPVKLVYDVSVCKEPYAIKIFLQESGQYIGKYAGSQYSGSMYAACLVLLSQLVGVQIQGKIIDIGYNTYYDYENKCHKKQQFLNIRLDFSTMQPKRAKCVFAKNQNYIDELIDIYKKWSAFVNEYLYDKTFQVRNTEFLLKEKFNETSKKKIISPCVYKLSYRVFEGDNPRPQGEAICDDFSMLKFLSKKDLELLCDIYTFTSEYEMLRSHCKSKNRYFRYESENYIFILSISRQKSRNGPEHWHNVNVKIYLK